MGEMSSNMMNKEDENENNLTGSIISVKQKLNPALDKMSMTGSVAILKNAADIAIDATSINNEEFLKQIERENRVIRFFDSRKKN